MPRVSLESQHLRRAGCSAKSYSLDSACALGYIPFSPIGGIHKIVAHAREVYRALDAAENFEVVLYPDVGHAYLPAMVEALVDCFRRTL